MKGLPEVCRHHRLQNRGDGKPMPRKAPLGTPEPPWGARSGVGWLWPLLLDFSLSRTRGTPSVDLAGSSWYSANCSISCRLNCLELMPWRIPVIKG